jgi:putative aminopeptidase FrvX
MPEKMVWDFVRLLRVQSSSDNEKRMVLYLASILKKFEIDKYGNMLYTKGTAETYPCIVAHMDTVHSIIDTHNVGVFIKDGREYAQADDGKKSAGVGGDDKCGLYACLHMIRKFPNIKVVFFTQEETGCQGSNKIDHSFFEDVGYIIQLDRWGRSDFISKFWGGSSISDEYKAICDPVLAKYGYSHESGLITDSMKLFDNGVGVSCVNVSCGYYQHHSDNEFIDLNEFYHSLLFTEELIVALGEKKYPHKKKTYVYNYAKHNRYDKANWPDYNSEWGDYNNALDFSGSVGFNNKNTKQLPPLTTTKTNQLPPLITPKTTIIGKMDDVVKDDVIKVLITLGIEDEREVLRKFSTVLIEYFNQTGKSISHAKLWDVVDEVFDTYPPRSRSVI